MVIRLEPLPHNLNSFPILELVCGGVGADALAAEIINGKDVLRAGFERAVLKKENTERIGEGIRLDGLPFQELDHSSDFRRGSIPVDKTAGHPVLRKQARGEKGQAQQQ